MLVPKKSQLAKMLREKAEDTPHRSTKHLRHVRHFACACWQSGECSGPIQAHHENEDMQGTMGDKTDDFRTIPLCFIHHEKRHSMGKHTFYHHYKLNPDQIIQQMVKTSPVKP